MVDDRTVRFHFKEPFLDFPILLGTGNVCGAGWVVPAKYYEQVGQAGFLQKPIGAGPYKLVSQEPGVKLEFEAFADYYRPVHIKQLDHGQRAGGGDARRDARARRGRHRLFHPGRTDRPGEEQSEAAAGAGGVRQLVAGVPRLPEPDQPVPRQARAPGDQPGRRSRRDQRRRVRRHGRGRRQLDQQRCRVRPGMAEVGAQRRQGEAADGRGRLSQRVQRRLGDADAELLFARRAHRLAASGDRHPRAAAGDGARRLS